MKRRKAPKVAEWPETREGRAKGKDRRAGKRDGKSCEDDPGSWRSSRRCDGGTGRVTRLVAGRGKVEVDVNERERGRRRKDTESGELCGAGPVVDTERSYPSE